MRKLSTAPIGAMAIGILVMTGCKESTRNDTDTYTANLTAAAEIPAPAGNPTATGTATLTLDDDGILNVVITISGQLTSDVTMAHIHGPASTTETGGIVLDFVPSMVTVVNAGTRTGTIVSTSYNLNTLVAGTNAVLRISADSLVTLMDNGNAYVNVHTVLNPAGELRGQITR